MRRFYAVLALVLVLVGSVHAQERDWLLTFYADRDVLLDHLNLGYFETLEGLSDCRAQVDAAFLERYIWLQFRV